MQANLISIAVSAITTTTIVGGAYASDDACGYPSQHAPNAWNAVAELPYPLASSRIATVDALAYTGFAMEPGNFLAIGLQSVLSAFTS